jgi:hypothetical protein
MRGVGVVRNAERLFESSVRAERRLGVTRMLATHDDRAPDDFEAQLALPEA